MKFIKHRPAYGTSRTIRKFLFLPVEVTIIGDDGEVTSTTRWLEMAAWEEKWTHGRPLDFWKKLRWID